MGLVWGGVWDWTIALDVQGYSCLCIQECVLRSYVVLRIKADSDRGRRWRGEGTCRASTLAHPTLFLTCIWGPFSFSEVEVQAGVIVWQVGS